jgi:Protein of unknown function (DUF2786)
MTDTTANLDKVRKLLAKAEAEGVTPPEAEAFTAKASELMARYGIDRALLAATGKQGDKPGNRMIDLDNPWKRVKAHLLCGLGAAMRCHAVLLTTRNDGLKVHMFGYESDLERVDLLYTSILVQMSHGVAVQVVPDRASPRAWRRSWLLGFAAAVITRVKAAEAAAVSQSQRENPRAGSGMSTELVLADRSLVVKGALKAKYPKTRAVRSTYSGTGYGSGYEKGQRADLGTGRVGGGSRSIAAG